VTELVEPPVRLVKLIGDAAMLVGPEPRPVLEAVLALVERAEDEGEEFPLLRAGVACGQALPRGGDWYGRPVNIASRVTAIARPGSVLADPGVHDALEDDYSWSFAGARRLKGIDGEVKLFRCRRQREAD
jgi:adenylate cyclase